jgi:hypothetical protein
MTTVVSVAFVNQMTVAMARKSICKQQILTESKSKAYPTDGITGGALGLYCARQFKAPGEKGQTLPGVRNDELRTICQIPSLSASNELPHSDSALAKVGDCLTIEQMSGI